MLPALADELKLPASNREGWLTGCYERICRDKNTGERSGIELGILCPVPEEAGPIRKEIGAAVFYGFEEDLSRPEVYDERLEGRFREVLEDFQPDIIHIFGTEFPHTLAMTRVFGNPQHTLIGIQGVCNSIAEVYMAELPFWVRTRRTFRDLIRHDSLKEQRIKYEKRARFESSALAGTGHITGRTMFDRKWAVEMNPDAVYHPMNETMRAVFYEGKWELSGAQPHRIFMSQGDYPLKGFHFILQAMPEILKKYPDTVLYIAGNSIIGAEGGLIGKKKAPWPLWITSYGLYLKWLIRRNHLKGKVFVLGNLKATEMKREFLKSHVYICPSVIENSPNSLCEAMLLGMPAAASAVGGIPDLIKDGEEGLLFRAGQIEEIAETVCRIFENGELARELGRNAAARAAVAHNPDTNYRRLMEIYYSMM